MAANERQIDSLYYGVPPLCVIGRLDASGLGPARYLALAELAAAVVATGVVASAGAGSTATATIANNRVLGNTSGAAAVPTAQALTQPAAGLTITGGTSAFTFALANDLAALEGLGSTGIAVRTAANTWAQRTITGTANKITVTDGDGVAANPTLTISATYVGQSTITTLGTIGTGVWQGTVIAPTYGGLGANASAWATGAIPYYTGSLFAQDSLFWAATDNCLSMGAAANANSSYQAIQALSAGYNEIAVYGAGTTAASNYCAISCDANYGGFYAALTAMYMQTIAAADVILSPASGIVACWDLASTTRAMGLKVYNTTDVSHTNSEWGDVRWSSNVLLVGSNKAGTGTSRDVTFIYAGAELIRLSAANVTLTGSGGQTVAAITDAGSTADTLFIVDTSNAAGGGGTILFGGQSAKRFAGIKGLLVDGTTNTIGDLAISTRSAVADAALTERLRIRSTGIVTFGGTTSSFPALKRSSAILQSRLADDTAYAAFEANTVRVATAYTVATLPAAGTAGRFAYVTDALTPANLVAVVGGGAVKTPVFDDGTNWIAL